MPDTEAKSSAPWMIALIAAIGASTLTVALQRRPAPPSPPPTAPATPPPTAEPAESQHDAIDLEQLEQLHKATLSASDSCFELKKICASVLVPTGSLIVIANDKKLTPIVFIAGLAIVVAFWLADSVGYFYQRKLRSAMTPIWTRLAQRSSYPVSDLPKTTTVTWVGAAFNASMLYYSILSGLVIIGFVVHIIWVTW
ncbi:hypothetical protein ACWEKT_30805 [Nocardia takedensis]